MSEIIISYETLYEILRKEKNKDEVQELPLEFYKDVVSYLNEKKNKISSIDPNLLQENLKAQNQMANIFKLLKELYDRREKKIISLALNKCKTGANIINTKNLLPAEKAFLKSITCSLEEYRNGILNTIINGKIPDYKAPIEEKYEIKKDDGKKALKFIEPVPKFVGKEMEVYGPFEIDQETRLPPEIVDLLVRKGKANPM